MKNQTYLVPNLCAAVFSKFKTTWINAIQKGYFKSWSGLTVQLVKKYITNSEVTARENIYQVWKKIDQPNFKK